jgi:hypothetical protein
VKTSAVLFCCFLVVGCATNGKVATLDTHDGHFLTSEKAKVVFEVPFDFSKRKEVLLVPSFSDDRNFLVKLVSQKKYFDEVVVLDDLERKAILAKPIESFPSVTDRFGMHDLAVKYRQFMWLEVDYSRDGNYETITETLTDPIDMKSYFKAEARYDQYWNGRNQNNSWLPLLNSFFDYLEKNK